MRIDVLSIQGVLPKVAAVLKDNAPYILTGLGALGVISSSVLSAKAHARAKLYLRDVSELREADGEEPLTGKEAFKETWMFYIPAVISVGASVTCIIVAQSISTRRHAAALGAYALVEKAFSDYKDQVVEVLGEKKERAVRDEVSNRHIQETSDQAKSLVIVEDSQILCHEDFTGRYFLSNMQAIRTANNDFNALLLTEGHASVNDLYSLLGLPRVNHGDDYGWRSDKLLELQFSSHLASEGRPCLSVRFDTIPKVNYYKGF